MTYLLHAYDGFCNCSVSEHMIEVEDIPDDNAICQGLLYIEELLSSLSPSYDEDLA